jgi:hypothetical protein
LRFAERRKSQMAAVFRGAFHSAGYLNQGLMRTHCATAKSSASLVPVTVAMKKLWHQDHLTYDETHDAAKEVPRVLPIERPKSRKRVVARLSREEDG